MKARPQSPPFNCVPGVRFRRGPTRPASSAPPPLLRPPEADLDAPVFLDSVFVLAEPKGIQVGVREHEAQAHGLTRQAADVRALLPEDRLFERVAKHLFRVRKAVARERRATAASWFAIVESPLRFV